MTVEEAIEILNKIAMCARTNDPRCEDAEFHFNECPYYCTNELEEEAKSVLRKII